MTVMATASLSPFVHASTDDDLRASLGTCQAIPNALRRLACFDRLAGDVENANKADGSNPTEAARSRSDLGPNDASASPPSEDIRSLLARLERRPRGEWVFHLQNGQRWTEIEPGRTRYRAGTEVRISRTLFGGYMLSVEGGRSTRVRRLE